MLLSRIPAGLRYYTGVEARLRRFVEDTAMIVRSAIEPRRVFEELVQRDILVRDVSSYPMLSEYFRISIGTPEENDALLNSLRSVFEKLP